MECENAACRNFKLKNATRHQKHRAHFAGARRGLNVWCAVGFLDCMELRQRIAPAFRHGQHKTQARPVGPQDPVSPLEVRELVEELPSLVHAHGKPPGQGDARFCYDLRAPKRGSEHWQRMVKFRASRGTTEMRRRAVLYRRGCDAEGTSSKFTIERTLPLSLLTTTT